VGPRPASPASRRGDRIVGVGGLRLEGLLHGEAIRLLRAAESSLRLTVRRRGPAALPSRTLLLSLFRPRRKEGDDGIHHIPPYRLFQTSG
jgi:hypothetical protein